MSANFGTYDHWQLEHDDDNIVWLHCDRKSEARNSLSEAVIRELGDIVGVLETLSLAGVVIGSAKPGSFIVGADIREFDGFDKAADVTAKIVQGHAVFERLEKLPCHTVAAIHGFCLGGGLELALCCNYIVALDVPETRLGFPEVKLGIFPGLGGTTRITERAGGLAGLQLMLTARMLRVPEARRLCVIDESVDEFSSLRWAARRAVLRHSRRRTPSLLARLSNFKLSRVVLSRILYRKTASKINPEHYPAPFQMIDLWRQHRDHRDNMFAGEARLVGELMVGRTARNLRRIFFLTERMKASGKAMEFVAQRVHVIGAGVMGGDIAAWCVLQGMEVTLQDRDEKSIESAIQRAQKMFRKRLKNKPALLAAQARLLADPAGSGVSRADVVIEAIVEDLAAKRALFASLESQLAEHAVLATNTSALPLEQIAQELATPSRLVGLHFFNPVAKMPLVEVVRSADTCADWVTRACAFCTQINRFPLPTKSSPGFLVNRVLAPYLMEAFSVLLQGTDKETIDAAAVRFGMPMGPIELADVVGLDVCMKVAETLARGELEDHRRLLQEKLDANALGKKTGQGFYHWENGKPKRRGVNVDHQEGDQLAIRLLQPLLDECKAVSAEEIVEDDDLLDAGVIFGTGFAPFRGGPMHYLKQQRETI